MSPTLVIGSGGLLGGEVLRVTSGRPAPRPIRWTDLDLARRDLDAAADAAADAVAWASRPLRVAWCAGAGVVGSTEQDLAAENTLVQHFLDALTSRRVPVAGLFLASSAGGVYAGADDQIITEETPPAPSSAYGHGKLRQEQTALAWSAATGTPVVVGRISNLYGAGQNLRKQQGLLSVLVRASLLRLPTRIYVDLDTRRDYLYATDAAHLVRTALDDLVRTASESGTGQQVRILASERSATIGEVVHELERIRKRRILAVYARSALSGLQPRSLAFSSLYPDAVQRTPLTVGLGALVQHQFRLLQAGRLA